MIADWQNCQPVLLKCFSYFGEHTILVRQAVQATQGLQLMDVHRASKASDTTHQVKQGIVYVLQAEVRKL